MKKLTLDETWKRCLAMWRWIVAELKKNPDKSVGTLKYKWLRSQGIKNLLSDCFFCEYYVKNELPDGKGCCPGCPGCLVSPKFSCSNPTYSWASKPAAFLRNLEALNRKRLAKKARSR